MKKLLKQIKEFFVPERYKPDPRVEAEWDRILRRTR